MNKPVSFDLAKLLKEKNIDIPCSDCYAEKRIIDRQTGGDLFIGEYKLCGKSKFHKRYYSAPTIVDVVMWLYEKHEIWISVGGDDDYTFKFEICNWKWYERENSFRLSSFVIGETFLHTRSEPYNSPTEAYEAALLYTLQKLIP